MKYSCCIVHRRIPLLLIRIICIDGNPPIWFHALVARPCYYSPRMPVPTGGADRISHLFDFGYCRRSCRIWVRDGESRLELYSFVVVALWSGCGIVRFAGNWWSEGAGDGAI
jgi:hypothetical protein